MFLQGTGTEKPDIYQFPLNINYDDECGTLRTESAEGRLGLRCSHVTLRRIDTLGKWFGIASKGRQFL